jgi:hypothetical protein
MDTTIIVALITAGATVIVTAVTFGLTKAKEREAEWRKQKLDHYKEFIAALNDIIGPPAPVPARIRFASASNNIYLVGSPPVLVALRRYLDHTADSNLNRANENHDELLTTLIFAIRDDLGIDPNRPDTDYVFRMWAGHPREDRGTPAA